MAERLRQRRDGPEATAAPTAHGTGRRGPTATPLTRRAPATDGPGDVAGPAGGPYSAGDEPGCPSPVAAGGRDPVWRRWPLVVVAVAGAGRGAGRCRRPALRSGPEPAPGRERGRRSAAGGHRARAGRPAGPASPSTWRCAPGIPAALAAFAGRVSDPGQPRVPPLPAAPATLAAAFGPNAGHAGGHPALARLDRATVGPTSRRRPARAR